MRIAHSLITTLVLSFSSIVAVGCATSGEDDFSEIDGEAAAAGKLTFFQSTDGQFRFNLKSGNGSILLTSEAYTSRTGSINGALSVLENGVDTAMYEVAATATGFVVRLKAANGEVISFSEVYSTKSNATRAVKSCVNAVTTYLDKREAVSAGKRVEVLENDKGAFRFNVHAANGQIVLSSESYETEAAAFNGAFAVQSVATTASAFTVKANSSGTGFFFTVTASNGQVIGVSQQYTTKQSAESAVASLKKLLPNITIL
jgi:uncharacterized protein YegP (UPF0339 family)